ncbi:hypothetical protein D9757_011843 [Collybiopsis confluens]|uniref:Uncharacterized protein n=1 Tax=Collybiopsis confluens TaxID=2823264 RepID=A0A8H5H0N0_9AGAR|nr:hypothetical protein D9757_011843 [Collybiopsis confluens]
MNSDPKSPPAAPTTPDQKPNPQLNKITPQSQNASSKTKADGSLPKRPEEYRDLIQDVSIQTFADLIFALKLNMSDLTPIQQAIAAKLTQFLAVAEDRNKGETALYDPLNAFLNAICEGLDVGIRSSSSHVLYPGQPRPSRIQVRSGNQILDRFIGCS